MQALHHYGGHYEMELVFAIVRRIIPCNTALCVRARVITLKYVLLDDGFYQDGLVDYSFHDESSADKAIAPYKLIDGYRYPFVNTTICVLREICNMVLTDPDYRGRDGYPRFFPVSMNRARVGPFIADLLMGNIIVWNQLAIEYTGTAVRQRADCGHQNIPINEICSRCGTTRCMRCCRRAHGMLRDVDSALANLFPPISIHSMTCGCGTPHDSMHTFYADLLPAHSFEELMQQSVSFIPDGVLL